MCKYEVKCKCGHVGRKNYIVIAFPIIANDGKEAALIARYIPRVKHNHKDAILSVREINDEEYESLVESNENDKYLQCKNKQEQNLLNLSNRVNREDYFKDCYEDEEVEGKHLFFGKIKVRNAKKFFKNMISKDNMEAYIW